jgi:hypothetical protein
MTNQEQHHRNFSFLFNQGICSKVERIHYIFNVKYKKIIYMIFVTATEVGWRENARKGHSCFVGRTGAEVQRVERPVLASSKVPGYIPTIL